MLGRMPACLEWTPPGKTRSWGAQCSLLCPCSLPTRWHPKQPAWLHLRHTLGIMPTPCGPSLGFWGAPTGRPPCSLTAIRPSPALPCGEGGSMGVPTSLPRTMGQECARFRANTMWAHSAALASQPRNTALQAEDVVVACAGPHGPPRAPLPLGWAAWPPLSTQLFPRVRAMPRPRTALSPQGVSAH